MPAGNYVKISFTDNGPGIPEALQKKVLDPFFTTKKRGTGLGLATVYSIVKKHDGHLLLESGPGKGATFTVWLPAQGSAIPPGAGSDAERKKVADPMASEADLPAVTSLKVRILIMDDEESMR